MMNSTKYKMMIGATVWCLILAFVAFGQTAAPELLPAQTIERVMTGAETHRYQVALQKDEFFQVRVEQKGVDVLLRLVDAGGAELARMDSPNSKEGPEVLSFVAAMAGGYMLEVSGFDPKAAKGNYIIRRTESRTATAQDRRRVEVERVFVQGLTVRDATALAKLNDALAGWRELSDEYLIQLTQRHVQAEKASALFFEALFLVNEGTAESKRAALAKFESARELNRESGSKQGEAFCLSELGKIYLSLGEKAKALEYYAQALPLYRAVGDRDRETATLRNIGFVYDYLGEKAKALEYHTQALPFVRAVGDREDEADKLNDMMYLWQDLANLRFAAFYGKQAVNIYQTLRGDIQGLDKKSQRTYLKSVKNTYRRLAGILIKQGRLPEAERVLEMLKEEEFFQYVRRNSNIASSLSKRVDLTDDEATAVAEYTKIAVELNALGRQLAALNAERSLIPEGRQFPKQAELNEVQRRFDVATRAYNDFLRRLADEFGKPDPRVKQFESGLQASLKQWNVPGAVIISTLVRGDLHIIVTTPNTQKAHTVEIKAADLNKLVAEFRAAIADPCACIDPRPAGQKLYDLLFKPIEQDLAGANAKTLLWSLDGTLRYVPVAALWDAKRGYVAERFQNVVITLASRDKVAIQPSPAKDWRALGLGVSKPWGNFGALSAVPEELAAIIREEATSATTPVAPASAKLPEKGLLPGRRLLDEKFTRAAFKRALGSYSVLHIASHFSFAPGPQASSFLLLGDGTPLTLDAVSNTNPMLTGVELLTLSACETAVGDGDSGGGSNGEEVEGFGALAQRQGALAVLATLWQVADPSTRDLMIAFYRIYSTTPGITKAEALQQAQLTLLRGTGPASAANVKGRRAVLVGQPDDKASRLPFKADPNKPYAHPYYWTPFILIGNWR